MDTYFLPDNHILAYTYRKYSDDEKNAAFNQSCREVAVALGRDLSDPESTDVYRDDYAVFEQSLWILENTPRQKAEGAPQVINLEKDKEKPILDRQGVLICPQALRYFAVGRLVCVRG